MLDTWYSFKADRAFPGQIDLKEVATGQLVVGEDAIEAPIVVEEVKIDDSPVPA